MGGICPVSQLKAQPTAVGKARQRELQPLGTFTHSQNACWCSVCFSIFYCPGSPAHEQPGSQLEMALPTAITRPR